MKKMLYGFVAMMFILAGQVIVDVAHAEEGVEKATPTMQEMATGVLRSIIETATQAKDFLAEQIPIVIKELLVYYTVMYAFYAVIGAVLLICTPFWIYKWHIKGMSCGPYNGGGYYTLGWVIGLFMGIVGAACFIGNIGDLLKITLAPRIWLIEYARHLI